MPLTEILRSASPHWLLRWPALVAVLAPAACDSGGAESAIEIEERAANPALEPDGVVAYRITRSDSGAEIDLLAGDGSTAGHLGAQWAGESSVLRLTLASDPTPIELRLGGGELGFEIGGESGTVQLEAGQVRGDERAVALFETWRARIDLAARVAMDADALRVDSPEDMEELAYSGQCFGFGTSPWNVDDACLNARWTAVNDCGWHLYYGSSVINSGGPGPTLYFCSVWVYYW